MSKKISISFYIKADKIKSDGTAPIYCRITLLRSTVSFSTGKYILPARWTSSKQLKLSRKEDDLFLKMELEQIRKKLHLLNESLSSGGLICDAHQIKNGFLNPSSLYEPNYTLQDVFKLHNERFWEKVKLEKRSPESFKKHKTVQLEISDKLTP